MKIEVECERCQSILRLDRSHAGKHVRCPVCGSTSPVPAEPQPARPVKPIDPVNQGPGGPYERTDVWSSELPDDRSSRRGSEPAYQEPSEGYQRFQQQRQFRPFAANNTNAYGVLSLGIGVLAFVMAFSCVCISPLLAIVGAIIALKANGQIRMVGLFVNFAAFVVGLFNSGFLFLLLMLN